MAQLSAEPSDKVLTPITRSKFISTLGYVGIKILQ